jgi:hypothetical protein
MAYIANTAFEARITNNRFEDLCNITGKFFVDGNPADCSAGLLCERSEPLDCEGFAGVKNENAWKMFATDSNASVMYACNTYDSKLINDGDNHNYFIGSETLGLGVPAGRYGTFTRIDFDNQSVYRFGVGNLSEARGDKRYFTIEGGRLAPAATAPESGNFFMLNNTGNFIEGTSNSFEYVDVVACKA